MTFPTQRRIAYGRARRAESGSCQAPAYGTCSPEGVRYHQLNSVAVCRPRIVRTSFPEAPARARASGDRPVPLRGSGASGGQRKGRDRVREVTLRGRCWKESV
ncbi:hypothetical protein GCM10020221_18020 [Streptomyces thioluteus]|uniref:Uncharacterized protein n=1 Tax=Streptomyces thioluteus TaxID=66431 RepID=A0ABN3WQU6_STRTU